MMGLLQFGSVFLSLALQAPQLRPDAASSIAEGVDHLYFALTFITLFFTIGIFSTIFFFMVKYRRRTDNETPARNRREPSAGVGLDHHSDTNLRRLVSLGFEFVFRKFPSAFRFHRNLRDR